MIVSGRYADTLDISVFTILSCFGSLCGLHCLRCECRTLSLLLPLLQCSWGSVLIALSCRGNRGSLPCESTYLQTFSRTEWGLICFQCCGEARTITSVTFCILQHSSWLHAVTVWMLQPLHLQRMLYTSHIAHHAIIRNITMNALYFLAGLTIVWPCNSSHLLVSFNCSSLVNHNLPLGSARFALLAFAFQASDGSDEESLKTPFEAAVRIKASWLRNDLPHLTQYSRQLASKTS